MTKTILLHNKTVEYSTKRSNRAKRLRLAVYYDGSLIVTIPKNFPSSKVEKYIIEKSKWGLEKLEYFKKLSYSDALRIKDDQFEVYKDEAKKVVERRIKHFNKIYGFKFGKITIKAQKTKWGSCSKKGNLNFNFKIVALPKDIRDYIIVHELCHLKEFNHSQKYWNLVAKSIPNFRSIKNQLNNIGLNIK